MRLPISRILSTIQMHNTIETEQWACQRMLQLCCQAVFLSEWTVWENFEASGCTRRRSKTSCKTHDEWCPLWRWFYWFWQDHSWKMLWMGKLRFKVNDQDNADVDFTEHQYFDFFGSEHQVNTITEHHTTGRNISMSNLLQRNYVQSQCWL